MIVLNEREYAERWLEKDVPWKKVGHVLHFVAKLYFSKGYSKEDVRVKLNEYMLRHLEGYNKVLDGELIDKAIASAKGRPLIELDGVYVTKAEVEKIQALDSKQMQRLMFTMLCLAKYHMAVNDKCNYWITEDSADIFHMAKIAVPEKKQNEMICELHNLGFIGFASLKKIDNLNIHVLIAEPDSPHEVFVDDFENAGLIWNQYCGKEYIRCDKCGRMVARTGRRQKYCRKCAKEEKSRMTVDARKFKNS